MTKKQLLRAISFVLITVMMLSGLTWLLRDRTTTLSTLYSEPDDTIDLFSVGSSHVNGGYIPGVLWQEYGISAHNVYSWSQPIWITYHYIVEGLKTQNPAVVAVDLYGLMYGNSIEQPTAIDQVNYLNSFSIDPGWNLLQMIGTVDDCGIDLRNPEDFLPLTHYHTRWKILGEDMFVYDPHNDPHYLKGYSLLNRITPVQQPAFSATEERLPPYNTAVSYLDKIVALSQSKGFDLIFILTPYSYQPNEPAIYNWIEDYAAQHGIPFLNYCMENGHRIGLDWNNDFSDIDHVNVSGALKLTHDLGQFIRAGNYNLRTAEEFSNREQLDLDAKKTIRTIELDAILGQSFDQLQTYCAANALTLLPANAGTQMMGRWTIATEDSTSPVFLVTDNTNGSLHSFVVSSVDNSYILYDPLLDKPVCTLTIETETGTMVYTDCGLS